MKNYNIGIIGYGGFGKFLHHWWGKLEKVKVVAVYGGSPESEDIREYENWEDLLRDDSIDIVSIATPPSFHAEMACTAMRHNKHVLLEKPVALTLEQGQEILRTQKETGMAITVDHMLRYNPIVKALIQLSKEETFGKLRHAVVSNYAQDESLPASHWFWNKEMSGGIFKEHAVHFFDIINALTTQQYSKVSGFAHNRNPQQQDQVAATVVYDQGLIASHYHSFAGPGFFEQTTIRLAYDLAKIEIEGWMPVGGTIKALVKEQDRETLAIIPGLKIDGLQPVSGLVDLSRPEGWGSAAADTINAISCGGLEYQPDTMVSGTFELPQTKSEVYGACVQDILVDLIQKIENPGHKLRVTVEDALESLRIADLATKSATENR